jgi:hypothetical protein
MEFSISDKAIPGLTTIGINTSFRNTTSISSDTTDESKNIKKEAHNVLEAREPLIKVAG